MVIPAISYAFVAAVTFSGLNASVGYLTNILDIPVAQVILIRNSSVFLLAIGYLGIHHAAHAPLGPKVVRGYMVVAGLGVAVSLVTGYYSMFYLTLSEFTTLRCMDPFATALLARIFLNERVTKTQICCCLLSMTGIALVTDPLGRLDLEPVVDSQHQLQLQLRADTSGHLPNSLLSKLVGVILCIPSMFGQAAELVSMRLVGDQATSGQMMVYLAFCPATVAAGYLGTSRTTLVGPVTLWGWIILFGVVASISSMGSPLGFIGQYTLTFAGQRVSGTQISIAMYFGVVSGTLLQWAIYGDHPSVTAFVGMIIIVVCGIYAAMYGAVAEVKSQVVDEEEDAVGEVNIPLLRTQIS